MGGLAIIGDIDMNKYVLSLLIFLFSLFPLASFAKSINMYDEPKDKAKIVGTVDTEAGIIPIYTPPKGEWIKVADPRDGNVGWIKTSVLGDKGNTEYTFTQRFINTGNSPQSYQIIQLGGSHKLSSQEIQDILKQNKLQQEQMQKNINKMIEDMNKLYQWNTHWFTNDAPFIMPVIVMPAQQITPATNNSKEKEKH